MLCARARASECSGRCVCGQPCWAVCRRTLTPCASPWCRYERYVIQKADFLGSVEALTEDDFVRIKMLGKGNGGEVLAVKHKATGTSMARKVGAGLAVLARALAPHLVRGHGSPACHMNNGRPQC